MHDKLLLLQVFYCMGLMQSLFIYIKHEKRIEKRQFKQFYMRKEKLFVAALTC